MDRALASDGPAAPGGAAVAERRTAGAAVVLLAAVLTLACGGPAAKASPSGGSSGPLEKASLRIGAAGQGQLALVPLTLADQLGYFRDEGLSVAIQDLKGEPQTLGSVTAGEVDVAAGLYENAIRSQAPPRAQAMEMIALFDLTPGLVLYVNQKHQDAKSIKDLANLRIGITAVGSPSEELVRYLFKSNGLDPATADTVAVGGGSAALTLLKSDQIQALVAAEPAATTIEQEGDGSALYDTRTSAGAKAVLGGPWPAGGLYLSSLFVKQNPRTVAALARAAVRALRWMRQQAPADIAGRLPQALFYPDGKRDVLVKALGASMSMYSADGAMPADGPDGVVRVLKVAYPATDWSAVDLRKTYDNSYVRTAAGALRMGG